MKRIDILKSFTSLFEKLTPTGLITPQALPFEQSLLGTMMVFKDSARKGLDVIGYRDEDNTPFYRDQHTAIYTAMLALDSRSEPIDLLTMTNELKFRGDLETIGGPSYLVELTAQAVTGANTEAYARVIIEKHVAREFIRIMENGKLRLFEGESNVRDLLNEIASDVMKLESTLHGQAIQAIGETGDTAYEAIITASENKGIIGIPWGLEDLDKLTLGIEKGELTVVAAETSGGKSCIALQVALNNLLDNRPGAMFALEMNRTIILHRLWSNLSSIEHRHLRSGLLSEEQWLLLHRAMRDTKQLKFYVNDSPNIRPHEMRAILRKLVRDKGIEYVIFDHLQMMRASTPQQNREREVSEIVMDIRATCKDLGIAGILLCQFNREAKDRSKPPELWNLKEASTIEQNCGTVVLLWEKPGLPEWRMKAIVAKARNGIKNETDIQFDRRYQRFENTPIEFPSFERGAF